MQGKITMPYRPILLLMLTLGAVSLAGAGATMLPTQAAVATTDA